MGNKGDAISSVPSIYGSKDTRNITRNNSILVVYHLLKKHYK